MHGFWRAGGRPSFRPRLVERDGDGNLAMDQMVKAGMAFGVDPRRREYYSLRQARYDALATDVSTLAAMAAEEGRELSVLEIGCSGGSLLRHLEARPEFAHVALSGTNLDTRDIHRPESYRELLIGDLMLGYPQIPSGQYDVVICEQVLEHLPRLELAIATIGRLVKPGGHAFVGVPIFPPPLHLARRYLVPLLDRATGLRKQRSHVQAFSMASFLREMRRHSGLVVRGVRGLRIVSGGLLRPLENHYWWWRLNRRLGALVPALCIEVQAILQKPVPGCPCADSAGHLDRLGSLSRAPFRKR